MWESVLKERLVARERSEVQPFSYLISVHTRLRNESTGNRVMAKSLSDEAKTLRHEKQQLQEELASKQSSIPPLGGSSRVTELEQKCASLQQKLNDALVQQSEYFRVRYEKQQQDGVVTQLQSTVAELKTTIHRLSSEASEREEVMVILKKNHSDLIAENGLLQRKTIRLEEENGCFLKEVLTCKQQEMELRSKIFELEEQLLEHKDCQKTSSKPDKDAENSRQQSAQSPNMQRSFGSSIPTRVAYQIDNVHDGECYGVCFSDDNRQIWTGGNDKFLKLWDPQLQSLGRLHCGSAPLCLDTAGERFVAGCSDSTCRVFERSTNRCLTQLSGHSEKIVSVCFSPSGQSIFSASSDRTIRVWDVNTGAMTSTILCHSSCNDVTCGNDQVCSAHLDGGLRFWDYRSGRVAYELKQIHDKAITSVRVQADGVRVLSIGRDNTLRLSDIRSGERVAASVHDKLSLTSNMARLALSPDGSFVGVGSATGAILLWSVDSAAEGWKPIKVLEGAHKGSVTFTAWAPDGRTLASVGQDRSIVLWK